METHDLRDRDGHACIYEVMGKKCPDTVINPCDSPKCVPIGDGKPEVFVGPHGLAMAFQPYAFYEEDRVRLTEYCQQHGLRWREPWKDSWRYPGWTTLILIAKA